VGGFRGLMLLKMKSTRMVIAMINKCLMELFHTGVLSVPDSNTGFLYQSCHL
jgi:hypothetical protein